MKLDRPQVRPSILATESLLEHHGTELVQHLGDSNACFMVSMPIFLDSQQSGKGESFTYKPTPTAAKRIISRFV